MAFGHPYTPYDIQVQFMEALYDALENSKVGIFESPTGTGKTLSLICASMTWLRDHKRRSLEGQDAEENTDENADAPQWVRDQAREMKNREYIDRVRDFEEKLKEIREIEKKESNEARFHSSSEENFRKRQKSQRNNTNDDDDYLVEDYVSDSEEPKLTNKSGLSVEVVNLLKKLGEDPGIEDSREPTVEDAPVSQTKIFFTSRTHSQLSQYIGQLRLTSFPPAIPGVQESETESIKEISLSSRKHLCIHSKVSKYNDTAQQNDACHEMQKKESTRCQFLLNDHKLTDRVKSTEFRNHAFAQIRDIEDLASLGKRMQVCPYYETRKAIPSAEIVSLPYQLLLQKSSRKALNIDLKGSVVIIDEAHNILETISSLHSLSISLSHVTKARKGLEAYSSRFVNRLNGSNKIYLAQLKKIVTALENFFADASTKPAKETAPGKEIDQNSILSGTADSVNVYKLEKYLEKSKLAFKIETYLESMEDDKANVHSTNQPALTVVISFLLAMSNPSSEGKIFYGRTDDKQLQLQYLLLDASEHFREVVQDARCVILAGGTMEPVNDYMNYLFPYLEGSRFKFFSCNHVIPEDNLSVSPLVCGPTKEKFLFTFAQRNSEKMMDELGKAIFNLSVIIPAGLVVFFPSYQYLYQLETHWKKNGQWERMLNKKPIFQEPKSASQVDTILYDYSACIAQNKSGAVLFSVVGGKMSEGINFSDDLARGIIMVGLPFPNLLSAEMVAKRDYIQRQVISNGGTKEQSLEAAKEFYENLCLWSVNQSIGRAIRHIGDYASIVLIDERYNSERIQKKLPAWIRKRLPAAGSWQGTFPETIKETSSFFRSKKN